MPALRLGDGLVFLQCGCKIWFLMLSGRRGLSFGEMIRLMGLICFRDCAWLRLLVVFASFKFVVH